MLQLVEEVVEDNPLRYYHTRKYDISITCGLVTRNYPARGCYENMTLPLTLKSFGYLHSNDTHLFDNPITGRFQAATTYLLPKLRPNLHGDQTGLGP